MSGTRARSCTGKKGHDEWAGADAQLKRMLRKGGSPDAWEVYECKHCKKWHVGHRSAARVKREAR